MGRKKETDEVKVKRVYPDAICHYTVKAEYVVWDKFNFIDNCKVIGVSQTIDSAWSDALKKINAAKKKSYYKHKIKRPNNEKKAKVNIMLYPSDKTAIIGKYGSVQKFINTIVEQIKITNNEVDKN